MEKRALIAVVLSLLILVLYQEWMAHYYGTPPPRSPVAKKPEKEVAAPAAKPEPPLQEPKPKAVPRPANVKEVRVETDDYVAVFTSEGARLKSFILKRYRTSVEPTSPPFEMIPSAPAMPYPLGLQVGGPAPFNDDALNYTVAGGDLKLSGDAKGTLLFQAEGPTGVSLTKEFTFTGSRYPIRLDVSVRGANGNSPYALLVTADADQKDKTKDAVFQGLAAVIGGKIKRERESEIKKGGELNGPLSWAAFDYTYFLFALLPQKEDQQTIAVGQKGTALVMEIGGARGTDGVEKNSYTLFIGPKELDTLKSMGKGLERSIDFGYFGFISIPLLYVMHFSHHFTESYGIDIILLTIIIKLLMAPLTHKSFVSMRQMQKLQPQMERIKEKFKEDKEKMNKEIMELYRRNKVNPLGGCLPMLLQFPVFVGLYDALRTPIELRHAPFMWIRDLSRPDWESLPVTVASWHAGVPILTLLMGASMLLQQWMTPSAGDPNQKRMMLMMPLVFTVMFINFPSGLTIYWLVNNVLSIAQQYVINRMDR